MSWYSVNTATMIQRLKSNIPEIKQVWLANDSAEGGRLALLYNWWKYLEEERKRYGYLVNVPECWLIVKTQDLDRKAELIFGEEVNITTEGKRRLGAVTGSKEYKDQYCRDKVQGRVRDISSLAEIANSQPHAAYIEDERWMICICHSVVENQNLFWNPKISTREWEGD